jgi:hypothetical protein
MAGKKFLKYTLLKREARQWFILPQDTDYRTCRDRQISMMKRVAICANQNGYSGIKVFHPTGVHLTTMGWEKHERGETLRVWTEIGETQLSESIGDVSECGRNERRFDLNEALRYWGKKSLS